MSVLFSSFWLPIAAQSPGTLGGVQNAGSSPPSLGRFWSHLHPKCVCGRPMEWHLPHQALISIAHGRFIGIKHFLSGKVFYPNWPFGSFCRGKPVRPELPEGPYGYRRPPRMWPKCAWRCFLGPRATFGNKTLSHRESVLSKWAILLTFQLKPCPPGPPLGPISMPPRDELLLCLPGTP